MSETERRLDNHDRQIGGINKLLAQGARMMLKLQAFQEENARQIKETQRQIGETNKTLDRFIRSIEGRGGVEAAISRFEQRMSDPDSPVRPIRRQPARTGVMPATFRFPAPTKWVSASPWARSRARFCGWWSDRDSAWPQWAS